jgi:hypothetical protein
MKKSVFAACFWVVFWVTGAALAGVPGALDTSPAATLIVPFFEVGINASTHSQDTFAIVYNRATTTTQIHYHVWDKNGNATDLYGEEELSGNATWAASMRNLIDGSTSAVKSALDDGGSYYRGFVTIDVVTAETTKNPTESGYPFATGSSSNVLEGFIYYMRLAEGSSNSMPMIPLNWVAPSGDSGFLDNFYQNSDGREEIDASARKCAQLLLEGAGPCTAVVTIGRVDSRVYLDPTYNATTRIIVFTWKPDIVSGPSVYCDTRTCESDYDYKQYDASGNLVVDMTIRLPNVVNVLSVSGTQNGLVSIQGIADPQTSFQVYGFSLTNASPASGASANWDAILPSYIEP